MRPMFTVPLALFSFPLVAIALFVRAGPAYGMVHTVLLGALFLPEAIGYDLPALPPYNKHTAIALGLVLGFWVTRNRGVPVPEAPGAWPRVLRWIMWTVLLSPIATVALNGDALRFGPHVTPGLGPRDAISMMTESFTLLVPFVLAWRYMSDPADHRGLLKAFILAGLGYSLLALFEVRMSPQLHRWIYGFFQHGWAQHIRGGGFRPIVFMTHGLWVGMFLLTTAIAAFALVRRDPASRRPEPVFVVIGLWFLGVLFLSRNFGATAIAALLMPVLWLFAPRLQIGVAALIAVLFIVHPAVRQTGMDPSGFVLEQAGRISAERAQSFAVRVENETEFLERAAERPVFGWGIWGRWRIRDAETGEDISTSDGRWISLLGERGWVGFLANFGLFVVPILALGAAGRRRGDLGASTAGLAMISAAALIYQIPNNTIGPLLTVIAGALAGYVARQRVGEGATAEEGSVLRGPIGYTRFPDGTAPSPSQRAMADEDGVGGAITPRARSAAVASSPRPERREGAPRLRRHSRSRESAS